MNFACGTCIELRSYGLVWHHSVLSYSFVAVLLDHDLLTIDLAQELEALG